MDLVHRLGLQQRWIYEALISTFYHGIPHAAPIGVWVHGTDDLRMDVYDGSRTLADILEVGQYAANFPADVCALYAALRAPEQLSFEPARCVCAPVVGGCTATVELTLSSATRRGEKMRLVGEVKCVYGAGPPRLINRAEGLLLESLVVATRPERLEPGVALAALTENRRVVSKVAPGSAYERALEALLRDLERSS
jgi:hypothetical protein